MNGQSKPELVPKCQFCLGPIDLEARGATIEPPVCGDCSKFPRTAGGSFVPTEDQIKQLLALPEVQEAMSQLIQRELAKAPTFDHAYDYAETAPALNLAGKEIVTSYGQILEKRSSEGWELVAVHAAHWHKDTPIPAALYLFWKRPS